MSMMVITEEIIHDVIELTRQAGSAIMEVYKTDFDIKIKDDNSPITAADIKAKVKFSGILPPPSSARNLESATTIVVSVL